MIFFFSGTGNSRWVASELAKLTNDTVMNISEYIKGRCDKYDFTHEDRIGIVFPIYTWDVPLPMLHFLKCLKISPHAYTYAVCTCGDDTGKAITHLQKTIKIDAAWSVHMPNTYIPMFHLDPENVMQDKLKKTSEQIKAIANAINEKERRIDIQEGSFPAFKTYVINPLFIRFACNTKGFHIEGQCTECGTCCRVCPMGNITIAEGKPKWGNTCVHCMACIHSCPERIIQYSKATQTKGRYSLRKELNKLKNMQDK